MSVEAAIVERLRTAAGVENRVYPHYRPQGTLLPSIVFEQVGQETLYSFDAPMMLRNVRLELDVLAGTFAELLEVSGAVRTALGGLRETIAGVDIQGSFVVSEVDTFDVPTDASDQGVHRRITDFSIWYQQQ